MNDSVFVGYYVSSLGIIKITAQEGSIVALSFVEEIGFSRSHPIIDACKEELDAYFSKKLTFFSLPLKPNGTVFQQEVWKTLMSIDYGKTVSYKELAIQMGRPSSVRAVANAISKNPILILIPCHRVIGSDGTLTGFAAGISRKKALLKLEKNPFS